MILDASFLIDLLAADPGAIAKLEEIADRHLRVPALAYTEVAISIDPTSKTGDRFDAIMEKITFVPYGREEAKRAVDIQRALASDGTPIGAIDAMIAGTAIAHDAVVVTRNVSDFQRTPVRISPY